MSFHLDLSIPNNDTAVVQKLDPKSLRPISGGTLISKSNNGGNKHIPRNSLEKKTSNGECDLVPGVNYTGQLTLVTGEKLGRKARLHVSLAYNGKITVLHRTQVKKRDKSYVSTYEETFNFQAPPEAHLVFGATAYHLVLRDEHLGIAQIPLNDPAATGGNKICIDLSKGLLNMRLNYPISEVEESDSPEFPISDYNYPEDDCHYEEKMYDQENVVV